MPSRSPALRQAQGPAAASAIRVPETRMMTVLYSGARAGTGYIDDIDSGVMTPGP
ncbi:MAG: hypothetical protein JST33_11900 [Actinobacteria bacterium]|nr:hypothetical protein [Actinomycetota bacterium]